MTEPSDAPDPQAAIRAYLADPATHVEAGTGRDRSVETVRSGEGPADTVTLIDTHANTIFLAGPVAYKMKRSVRFPFLDYSTLALREAACRHEVEVNRGPAAALYRGVVAVTHTPDGRLELGGEGEPVEWLVVMTRFDETATLDRRLERGPLAPADVEALAVAVARMQAAAPVRAAGPWIDDLAGYVEQNDAAFRAAPEVFPPAAVAALTQAARLRLASLRDLLEERGRLGFIRLLHGDLHAGNVAWIDGAPVPFDAIEFDDRIATADLLYDAGFLVMDLDERGQRPAANLLLNRILVETVRQGPAESAAERLLHQVEGLAALPFFLMMRAAIRAKIAFARAAHLPPGAAASERAAARRYFDAAVADLEPAEPVLVAVGGLSGSGKSTLARALAPGIGRPPGALHLRSDVIRKLLAGVAETDPLPPAGYTREASAAVYRLLVDAARAGLATGSAVIVDAVAARPEERRAIAAAAAAVEARFVGLWLDAPDETRAARVDARRGDASDADRAVVAQQAGYEVGPMDWTVVPTADGPDAALATARSALAAAGVALAGGR